MDTKAQTTVSPASEPDDVPMPWCEPCGSYHAEGNHLRRVNAERDKVARVMLGALKLYQAACGFRPTATMGEAMNACDAAIAAAEAAGITAEG